MSILNFWNPLKKTTSIGMIAIASTLTISLLSCKADTPPPPSTSNLSTNYHWQNVSIGGGGYVTGVYLHPTKKDVAYIRTDIGGFYRWDAKNKKWLPLNENLSLKDNNYFGGEALAIDPNYSSVIYIAAGKYTASWSGTGTIFKSSDRGDHWTKLNINLPMGGNEDKRWLDARLAVNPFNSQDIFFGSRLSGLWKSSDSGTTWAQVTSFPGKSPNNIGISSIVFGKTSGVMYANANGDGLYQSNDTGLTWSKISGSPAQVNRLVIASNGTVYVTHADGVSKYKNNVWTSITPSNAKASFSALSVDPRNPDRLLIAYDQYNNHDDANRIFQSNDGGSTWQQKTPTLNHQVSWWYNWYFGSATAAVEFDPQVPGKAWLTDWYGVWQTQNIDANPTVWTNYEKGHEQLVSFALAAPPQGSPLISGMADVDGFNHNNGLNAIPSKDFTRTGAWFQDTYSIAYGESNSLQMVRVGGHRWNNTFSGATSADGGLTWKQFPSFPPNKMPLRVAMSATNPNLFVATISNGQAIRTTDGGNSWSAVSGLPSGPEGAWYWGQPLVADKVDGNIFYYYSDGKVYRSEDGGANFSLVNAALNSESWSMIKTLPGAKGEVWLSLNGNGLYRSPNGGTSFNKIAGVESAYLFAFGKPPADSNVPALYVYGKITGLGEGIFRSLDYGKTWASIGSSKALIGNQPNVMEASRQTFGLVFVGTNGRGVYYGTP
jgi:xyloglucan-specific exo-beta-1,4-glucanase